MRPTHVAFACLLVGCSSRTPASSPPPDASGAAPAVSAAGPKPSASADSPSARALPRAFAALGQACPSDLPHTVLCGTDGKVAAIFVPVDHAFDIPPAGAEILRHEPRTTLPERGTEFKVGLEGERLWILHVTCGTCRRIMGTSFVGDIGRLTVAQLVDVQRRLGVGSEVALKDGAAWRAYYRALAPAASAR